MINISERIVSQERLDRATSTIIQLPHQVEDVPTDGAAVSKAASYPSSQLVLENGRYHVAKSQD